MKQFTSLVWKEWFEVRSLLCIALFVFLGLPVIGGLEEMAAGHHFFLYTSVWVFMLGGVLAVVVAVGVVVRDMNGKVEEFWRSRPVSVVRWLAVKYVMGLAVVLAALIVPLVCEILVGKDRGYAPRDSQILLAWHPFFWAALYSISFAVASLIRRGAHAAIVSIAFLLLLYFLPPIVRPIQFLSLLRVQAETENLQWEGAHRAAAPATVPWLPWPVFYVNWELAFAAGMLGICGLGALVAMLAVRRNWRIEAGRKMIYWSIGLALLVLMAAAAYQVPSNLQPEQTVIVPTDGSIFSIQTDGQRGVILSIGFTPQTGTRTRLFIQKFQVDNSGIQLGNSVYSDLSEKDWYSQTWYWNADRPDLLYIGQTKARENVLRPANSQDLVLGVSVISLIDGKTIWEKEYPELLSDQWAVGNFYAFGNRLYLIGTELLTFDVSEPTKPQLLPREKLAWRPPTYNEHERIYFQRYGNDLVDDERVTLSLPQLAELSPRQRLELSAITWPRGAVLDGDRMVQRSYQAIVTYRLEQLTNESATFSKAGQYEIPAIQKMFGYDGGNYSAKSGLFFETGNSAQFSGVHLMVYETSSSRPHPVGHYALPGYHWSAIAGLPDGRAIVGSGKYLYLLARPTD